MRLVYARTFAVTHGLFLCVTFPHTVSRWFPAFAFLPTYTCPPHTIAVGSRFTLRSVVLFHPTRFWPPRSNVPRSCLPPRSGFVFPSWFVGCFPHTDLNTPTSSFTGFHSPTHLHVATVGPRGTPTPFPVTGFTHTLLLLPVPFLFFDFSFAFAHQVYHHVRGFTFFPSLGHLTPPRLHTPHHLAFLCRFPFLPAFVLHTVTVPGYIYLRLVYWHTRRVLSHYAHYARSHLFIAYTSPTFPSPVYVTPP